MDDSKKLDMKEMKKKLNDNKLTLASSELLKQKLGLIPGMISLFGILNNKEKDLRIIIDKEVMDQNIITFLANTSTATIFIKTSDMLRFIESMSYSYELLEL